MYIRPAEDVVTQGTRIETPPTYAAATSKLRTGESLVAVAQRGHGKVALLIRGQHDFDHVCQAGGDLFIVPEALAKRAS